MFLQLCHQDSWDTKFLAFGSICWGQNLVGLSSCVLLTMGDVDPHSSWDVEVTYEVWEVVIKVYDKNERWKETTNQE